MSQITVSGVARYPHLVNPSASKGSDKMQYSVNVLVSKNDANQVAMITQAMDAAVLVRFPNGAPAVDFRNAWVDLAIVEPQNKALANYWSLKVSSDASEATPSLVDMNRQPLMTGEVKSGDKIYVSAFCSAYNQKGKGVKAYLNATMTTGEQGEINPESLSNIQSVEDLFQNVAGGTQQQPNPAGATNGGNAPMGTQNAPASPTGQQAPPTPPVPPVQNAPATNAAPVKTMQASAGGTPYEKMVEAGWTDQMMVDAGHLIIT